MTLHDVDDYKKLEDMDIDTLIEVLQICYNTNIKCTNYRGQEVYIGNGADYLAYAVAQGAKQVIQILEACKIILSQNFEDNLDEGEY